MLWTVVGPTITAPAKTRSSALPWHRCLGDSPGYLNNQKIQSVCVQDASSRSSLFKAKVLVERTIVCPPFGSSSLSSRASHLLREPSRGDRQPSRSPRPKLTRQMFQENSLSTSFVQRHEEIHTAILQTCYPGWYTIKQMSFVWSTLRRHPELY